MTDLRSLLIEAVPELPAPEDRVAEVGARVRHRRRVLGAATAGTVAIAVGLAIAVPNLLQSAAPRPDDIAAQPDRRPGSLVIGPDGCPGSGTDFFPSNVDTPGPLVPVGATDIALCELGPIKPMPGQPLMPATRVLHTGVDEMVRMLNDLPGPARYMQILRERAIAIGITDPNANIGPGCTFVGYSTKLSLRLRYPNREPVYVLLDQNCATARAGDATRHWWPHSPLVMFFDKYRQQLADSTDPASVQTPACSSTISVEELRRDRSPTRPVDGVAVNRGAEETGALLPSPLVAVVVCRYTVEASGARLAGSRQHRGDLSRLHTKINEQFAMNGSGPLRPMTECGNPDRNPLPNTMDAVWVADATGATSEVWLYRTPCQAAIRAGYGSLVPHADLVAEVEALLR